MFIEVVFTIIYYNHLIKYNDLKMDGSRLMSDVEMAEARMSAVFTTLSNIPTNCDLSCQFIE